MSKITMLSGLPASGKSTHARDLVRTTGNSARVNRDDLRAMLFDGTWSPKREKVVVAIEKAIATILMEHDLNPIIDDTNLTVKHKDMWAGHAQKLSAKFDTIYFGTDVSECIARDARRDKPIGEAVISRMALFNGKIHFDHRPIALVDIDGTVADGSHREHFLKGEIKDWDSYFAMVGGDSVYHEIVEQVKELAKTHMIIIVSGRPDTCQFETIEWLHRAGIPFDWIFMRPGSERKPDYLVKQDILNHLPKEKIAVVLDDRYSVIKMWRENGLNVIPVRGTPEDHPESCPNYGTILTSTCPHCGIIGDF